MSRQVLAVLLLIGLTACSVVPVVKPQFPEGMAIECGPIVDPALCEKAVAVALTAQLNPPPAVSVQIRLPMGGDDCRTWLHACDAGSVIAVIQSGDTLQDVPLVRTVDGWVRLDAVR